jgi:aconitate hydratase
MPHNLFESLQSFTTGAGAEGKYYSLPALEAAGVGPISRLPVSIRVVLESVLRNYDEKKVRKADVKTLANWGATAERTDEIPFVVARVLLQNFKGVPLLVDLAAMNWTVERMGLETSVMRP